jgi:hypothetical protein
MASSSADLSRGHGCRHLLITAAGGAVGNYAGESRQMEQGEVLAGNPKAFAQMVRLLAPLLARQREARRGLILS